MVETEGRIRREALDLAESLAMTPRSRVKLGVALVQAAASTGDEEEAKAAGERLDERFAVIDADAEEEC